MLDLDSISALDSVQVVDTPAATQETTAQAVETQQQSTTDTSAEVSGGSEDFLSAMDRVIEEAVNPKAPEKKEDEKQAEEAKTQETVASEDADELETPEMKAAVSKMSMKSAEAFNKIKANANAKIAEYKAKIAEIEAKAQTPVNDAKIEELNAAIAAKESALAEKSKKLAFHEITEHPEYEDAVLKPTQIIKSKVEQLAARYELDVPELIKAITEKNPKAQADMLSELASGMSDFDKNKFYQIPDDWGLIIDKENMLRENAVKAWEEVQSNRTKEQEETKSKMTQERKKLGEEVWTKLTSKVPALKDLNADTLKAQFDATDFDSMKPVDKVASLAAAVTFAPVIQKLMSEAKTKDSKIAELEASLKKYINTSPGAGSGVTADVSEPVDANLGFLGALEKMMQKS